MTKKITDRELENIDGGMDPITDIERNPPQGVDPKATADTGSMSGGGSATSGELQENPDRDPS